jgi:O-methyltransferase
VELDEVRALYLELLKASVRNTLYRTEVPPPGAREIEETTALLARMRERFGVLVDRAKLEPTSMYHRLRANSPDALTLADAAQVDNVQRCVEDVIRNVVPGDLIETGVFRGGQTILMRGILKAYGVTDRTVFVADSFAGLPTPDPGAPVADLMAHEFLGAVGRFRVTEAEVRASFARYGLLDDQVRFLPGWFRDTLPHAPIARLAVMRLDGDYYESTMDALRHLYPKLSVGGYAIIDDYGVPVGCRRAVDEYRSAHAIDEPFVWVNANTVYWQRVHPAVRSPGRIEEGVR